MHAISVCFMWYGEGFGGRMFFRVIFFLFLTKKNSEVPVLVVCKSSVIHIRDTSVLLLVDFTSLC